MISKRASQIFKSQKLYFSQFVGGHFIGANCQPLNNPQSQSTDKTLLDKLSSKIESVGVPFEFYSESNSGVEHLQASLNSSQIKVHVETECPVTIKTIEDEIDSLKLNVQLKPTVRCPWFPRQLSDLDYTGKLVQEIKVDEENPYTCHTDEEYKKKFAKIAQRSNAYKMGDPIPTAKYTEEEHQLWRLLYPKLRKGVREHGTKEFNRGFEKLEDHRIFTYEKIPDLEEVNQFLQKEQNWRFKMAGGSIDQREFLNLQAFRASTCTQYIRHPSDPYFTPVPDIIHELCGHVPMVLDDDYANFNQQIGMLSLGATETQLKILAAIYWYTSEFGVVYEDNKRKFYGAGQASSVKELQSWLEKEGTDIFFDLTDDINQNYSQENLKPQFYASKSYKEVIRQFKGLDNFINRSFNLNYDEKANKYTPDRVIFMEEKKLLKEIEVVKK